MHEFRPVVHSATLRFLVAAALVALSAAPIAFSTVFVPSEITYTITQDALVVHPSDPFAEPRSVPLSDVVSVELAPLQRGTRIRGTKFPGYCVGYYHYANLGRVWQATDCGGRGLVVRSSQEDVLVLTPPDPKDFRARMNARQATNIVLGTRDAAAVLLPVRLVVAVTTLVMWMAAALAVFGPSRMRYRVGDGALEVRTMYGRQRFALAGAVARKYTPSAVRRRAGTFFPGYYTGRFLEGGKSTRLYATDLVSTVVVEGEARVVVSPRNREGFLAALHAEGADVPRTDVAQ